MIEQMINGYSECLGKDHILRHGNSQVHLLAPMPLNGESTKCRIFCIIILLFDDLLMHFTLLFTNDLMTSIFGIVEGVHTHCLGYLFLLITILLRIFVVIVAILHF
jgi:hypothetical protein